MAGKNVVVLGGGFGGAACALEAALLLGDEHRVSLVDRSRIGYLCGANPFLIIGERPSDGMTRDLDGLSEHGVEVVEAEIEGIEFGEQRVRTSREDIPYDYLVVALGATYDWDRVPGSRAAHAFYDHASAVRLRGRLDRFEGGSVVIGVAGAPIKCPPAPFETAMLIAWALAERGAAGDVHVVIPEPAPMGVAGPDASSRIRTALAERGVTLHTGAAVVAVDGPVMHLADGTELRADVPITVPLHRLPGVVAETALTDGKPWVPVDRDLLETSVNDVFAIGDANTIPVGEAAAVPKAGVFAAGQGRTVARVIAARVRDVEPPPPYDGVGHCFIGFSGVESASIGGDFFAAGGPAVTLGEPSAAGIADKEVFEARWASFAL